MWLDTVVDRRTVLCVLDRPPASADELLPRVLTDFGILNRPDPPAAVSSRELTQVLQRFLAGLRTLNAHAFIVIDNAEGADDPTRAEIDRLSGLDPGVLEVLLVDASTRPPVVNRRRMVASAAAIAAVALTLWFSMWTPRHERSVSMPDLRELSTSDRVPAVELTGAKTAPSGDATPGGRAVGLYRVQVGAFRDPSRADAASARLRVLKLSVGTELMPSGLRQVTLGPYLLRTEAASALAAARSAGFTEALLVKLPGPVDSLNGEDRALVARAEALAEAKDVRGLEALRAASADTNGSVKSPVLATIDQYLDAARRAQLAADRQQLLRDSIPR
jgi:hypothetical protein